MPLMCFVRSHQSVTFCYFVSHVVNEYWLFIVLLHKGVNAWMELGSMGGIDSRLLDL